MKQGVYAAKTNVPTADVEFRKSQKECTHKPQLIDYKPADGVNLNTIKGIEIVLDKMLTARVEKEKKALLGERSSVILGKEDRATFLGQSQLNFSVSTKKSFGEPPKI